MTTTPENTVDLHLSGIWLSGSPVIRIALALPLNIFLPWLYHIFLWLKDFYQLPNTHKELCINILFVRK